MEKRDCEALRLHRILKRALLTLFAIGLTFTSAFHRGTSDRITRARTKTADDFDRIFKDLKNLSYPPNDFYKVVQYRIPQSVPHPCETTLDKPQWRSLTPPKSAHKLRPGDIDVIAAMGDSLTSANSAREESGIGVVIQDRGVSLSGGGLGTWREITTLPNIIKIFNPNLIGFARDRGDFLSENAQLNVAVPAALDDDIMNQVKLFIYKMRNDRRIDFNNHWKLLTIFIGHNDICSYHCLDRERHSPRNHALNLQKGLDYLYKHVPRIFINIMSILDPTIATRGPFTNECLVYLRLFCACLFRTPDFNKNRVSISRVVRHYQAMEKELALSGRYDGREDFAVVIQPFMIFLNGPTNIGEPESPSLLKLMSESEFFWSRDCFHFNQRGLASASIHLWNNMVEPVGNKSMTFEGDYAEYKCPSKKNPYFFTTKNTATFYREGHQ